ncbi:glycosyltransferase family 8 protein [Trichoderma barbatum]
MLPSAWRVAVAIYAVTILITLAVYEIVRKQYISHSLSFLRDLNNSSLPIEKGNTRFAYAQYATDIDYLCNTIINFNRLKRFGTKYDMVLIFPKAWDHESANTREAKAIQNLRASDLNIVLRPVDILSTDKGDSTWRDSLTKFHAFALIEYTRILAFDSDSLVLNNMDFLFLAPDSPVAMPRAYWLTDRQGAAKQILGSHLMLIEPNTHRYERIINEAMRSGEFDMEVMNELFKDSAMILPHRRLALLTGEFRNKNHYKYLAPDEDEEWNALVEADRAYLVHFSDWPLPKPWRPHTEAQWQTALPECPDEDIKKPDRLRCADRFVWTRFYTDYDNDKRTYCDLNSV